jgi:hypothetical protein
MLGAAFERMQPRYQKHDRDGHHRQCCSLGTRMTASARRLLAGVLALTAVVHWSHLGRYFVRDEVVALHRVSMWSYADVLARATWLVRGEVGERPHVLGYLFVKMLWSAAGPWFPAYAAFALVLHLTATALVGIAAGRIAPQVPALRPLAALLFGVWGATFDIGTFAVVEHLLLAIGAAGLVAAYAAFRAAPSPGRVVIVVAFALLSTLSLESGPLACLGPLLIELCLRSQIGEKIGAKRARMGMSAACLAVGLPRLFHDAIAVLSRGQVLDAAAPERYAVSFGAIHVIENAAYLAAQVVGGALWAAVPLAMFGAVGLWNRRTRAVSLFGLLFGAVLAAPFCAMAATAPFYAYTPSVGWALWAAASVIASAGAARRVPRGVVCVAVAALVVVCKRNVSEHDARDAAAFSALRAVRAGLMAAIPAGNASIGVALYGVPTGKLHPDYPLMLEDALPVLVPGRRLRPVWVFAPAAVEPLHLGDVTFTAHVPDDVYAGRTGVRSFVVRGDRLTEVAAGPR